MKILIKNNCEECPFCKSDNSDIEEGFICNITKKYLTSPYEPKYNKCELVNGDIIVKLVKDDTRSQP